MKKIALIMLSLLIALPFSVAPAFAASYTSAQVATHNSAADCWTIVNGNVYNLTSFIAQHPGGVTTITSICGIDGSATFNAIHGSSSAANAALANLLIGTLAVADTSAPSVPSGLAATLNSSNKVALSWNASTDNVGVTGYNILRNGTALATSTSTTYLDTTVIASTTYSYTVSAFDAAGNTSATSSSVSITTPINQTSDTVAPSVPTNLIASPASTNLINLSWATSTDNVAVTGYNVYRNSALVGTSTIGAFSDTGLTASTTYMYTVSAFDAAGNTSAQSTSVSATTLAPSSDTTAPSIPTGLVSSLNSHNKVLLSWNASTDNTGVAGYTVMRNGLVLSNVTSTNFLDNSVMASTTYSYTVLAYDAAGNKSAQSISVSLTTGSENTNPGKGHEHGNKNDGENENTHGKKNEDGNNGLHLGQMKNHTNQGKGNDHNGNGVGHNDSSTHHSDSNQGQHNSDND